MAKRENEYKPKLIKKIEERFPGCMILKNDEQLLPGIPDMLILHGPNWAVLEVKRDEKERRNPRPLQEHYVEYMNNMGFAAFVYPSNEDEVLNALQRSFEAGGNARVPEPE